MLVTLGAFTDEQLFSHSKNLFCVDIVNSVLKDIIDTSKLIKKPLSVVDQYVIAGKYTGFNFLATIVLLHNTLRAVARNRDTTVSDKLVYSVEKQLEVNKSIRSFSANLNPEKDRLGDTYHFWAQFTGGVISSSYFDGSLMEQMKSHMVKMMFNVIPTLMRLLKNKVFNTNFLFGFHEKIDQLGFEAGTELSALDYLTMREEIKISKTIRAFDREYSKYDKDINLIAEHYRISDNMIKSVIFAEHYRRTNASLGQIFEKRGASTYIKSKLISSSWGRCLISCLGGTISEGFVHKKTKKQIDSMYGHNLWDGKSGEFEDIARTIKAHLSYWKDNNYDLYSDVVKTIKTDDERIGIIATLFNIYDFGKRTSQPNPPPLIGGFRLSNSNYDFGELAMNYAKIKSGLADNFTE